MTLQEQDSALRQLVSALQLKNVTLVDDPTQLGGKRQVETLTLELGSQPRVAVQDELSDLMDATPSDAPQGYSQRKVDMLIFVLNARVSIMTQYSTGMMPQIMNQEIMILPVGGTVQAALVAMLKDELLKIVT
jgi:hypothetical protein